MLFGMIWGLVVVFAVFAADVDADDFVDEFFAAVEFDCAFAVAAVPETIVEFFAVRGFVVDEEHILLFASDVRHHTIAPSALFDVPNNLRVRFFAVEFGASARPELGEVELIAFAFVAICGEEFALQGNGADLRASAADIKDAVFEFLARDGARQVV